MRCSITVYGSNVMDMDQVKLSRMLRDAEQTEAEAFTRVNGEKLRFLSVPWQVREALNLLHGFTIPVNDPDAAKTWEKLIGEIADE